MINQIPSNPEWKSCEFCPCYCVDHRTPNSVHICKLFDKIMSIGTVPKRLGECLAIKPQIVWETKDKE